MNFAPILHSTTSVGLSSIFVQLIIAVNNGNGSAIISLLSFTAFFSSFTTCFIFFCLRKRSGSLKLMLEINIPLCLCFQSTELVCFRSSSLSIHSLCFSLLSTIHCQFLNGVVLFVPPLKLNIRCTFCVELILRLFYFHIFPYFYHVVSFFL